METLISWIWYSPFLVVAVAVIFTVAMSFHKIGPDQVGLVTKRFGKTKTSSGPISLTGESGYQADLLMSGIPFKLWPLYKVERHPWVQIPPGEIGLVVSQIGGPLPTGAKSAIYKSEFGQFTDLRIFLENGGQQGVQRPVLPPGALLPLHPIAFLVMTKSKQFGLPVNEQYRDGRFGPEHFGVKSEDLKLTLIEPRRDDGKTIDMVGIVTTNEGDPLASGDMAGRLGRFDDVKKMEDEHKSDSDIADVLIGNKNNLHNNYQDFQAFLDNGGKIGLQHDPLLYGAYTVNPYLVRVETVPMLVVKQGEVAVIKAAVGLPTEDTSGAEFKFGSIVKPGHRGIWQEPLRTGKYAINPRIYSAEVVPTAILTLNWAAATSQAHNLDKGLSQIEAKSKEGFVFKIDLQVQIHVADKMAPKVISMVGTMQNLVNEVLQAVVGNYFRDQLQGMGAIDFIEKRAEVQVTAQAYIAEQIQKYNVETRGVYIQDVVLPPDIVVVLQEREIANQEIKTFEKQKESQEKRLDMEKATGLADKQKDLATSEVEITIEKNKANARVETARGEATYLREVGRAKAVEIEATGLAQALGYKEQVAALGAEGTAIVNVVNALVRSATRFVPDILVQGGAGGTDPMAAISAGMFGFLKHMKPASIPESTVPAVIPGQPTNGEVVVSTDT
ncbi:MAG: hypothetical protein G01um101444_64 [Parcubacteria group bacterium Gr01-1014_44]|nr:MAG: hypothetical protein G01um101444_64 [Parcubacteria group bacterium Gr01-1014_44]